MLEPAKPLLLAATLLSASVSMALSQQPQRGPSDSQRHSTMGTGSCSGALGAEPGCQRSHRKAGSSESSDNDDNGPAAPSSDRMGPNAVGRGSGDTGMSGQGGNGADGLGGGNGGR